MSKVSENAMRSFLRPRSLGKLLPLTLALVVFSPQAASAATVSVSVQNNAFSPATAKAQRGDFVKWTFKDFTAHTATDSTGMNLFNSGNKTNGQTYTTPSAFVGAGTYAYRCNLHFGMTGKISVPMKATPATGGLSTSFTVTWASAKKTGFNFDVQIKRPGSTTWANWKVDQTSALGTTFKADKGKGKYQFQARLQKGTGAASNYSTPVAISVS